MAVGSIKDSITVYSAVVIFMEVSFVAKRL